MKQRVDNLTDEIVGSILEHLSEAVVVVDSKGQIINVNRSTSVMFGYAPEELVDQNVGILTPFNIREKHDIYMSNYLITGEAQIIGKGRELTAERKDGHQFPIELMLSDVTLENGKSVFIGIIRNITERHEQTKLINSMAFIDPITRLGNSNSFNKDFDGLLLKARLLKHHLSVHLISFYRFHKINHSYGHSFGNDVIKYIAKNLAKLGLTSDFQLYRLNGVKFILVVSHCNSSLEAYEEVINELQKIRLHSHTIDGHKFELQPVTVAYSKVAEQFVETSQSIKRMLEICHKNRPLTDESMLISQEYLDGAERKIKLEKAMKEALDLGEQFFLEYQPQYNKEQNVTAVEALIRWDNPLLGTIYPDEIIEVAERTGLIIPLTHWIVRQALTDLKLIHEYNSNIRVSVNISANHITLVNFADEIIELVEQSGVDPTSLMLEITENSLINDADIVLINALELKEHGISLSIDDFGTGYSSLHYLNMLPFSELKIDKSFIDNIENNESDLRLLETMLVIAIVKELEVVVEGVETQAQFEILKDRHIDLFQGYVFSRPLSLHRLLELI